MGAFTFSHLAAPFYDPVVVTPPLAVPPTPRYFYPQFASRVLAVGIVGTAYSQALAVLGDAAPYLFLLVDTGSLPAGMALNATTGVISGTPTTVGTTTFSILVFDRFGYSGLGTFIIAVSASSGGSSGGNYGWIQ
jgi:hypothetical protein